MDDMFIVKMKITYRLSNFFAEEDAVKSKDYSIN